MRAIAGIVLTVVLGACGGAGSPGTPPVQVAPGVTAAPSPAGAGGPATTPASDYQENYGY